VNVEDHPLDYMQFEGIIPQGQYGGGTVMVWDLGTYEIIDGNYWKGRLHLFLNGRKAKGEWLLERTGEQRGEKSTWRLTKVSAGMRALSVRRDDTSALSGRSMAEISAAADAIWQSNRSGAVATSTSSNKRTGPAKRTVPQFVSPMLALKTDELPRTGDWLYEWKWDGYRAVVTKHGNSVAVYSRKGRSLNNVFPAVVEAVRTIHADVAELDGEIVAINAAGEISFQHLQHRTALPRGWHIVYIAFDLLNADGMDWRERPLRERKAKLHDLVQGTAVLYSVELTGEPTKLIRTARLQRREGIVAKRAGSAYEGGARSRSWLKLQTKPKQEFVVGGYRPGHGNLQLLLVGYYDRGKLLYAGKVRIGLNPTNRAELFAQLKPSTQRNCPFANLPNSKRDHFGETVTADEMDDYVWVVPELVVEVEFTEWTRGNVLRHAAFAGWREDKAPTEVVKE
jgi:bifunctional non-homologous end joining protein LigD